jgi:hypothetical protein
MPKRAIVSGDLDDCWGAEEMDIFREQNANGFGPLARLVRYSPTLTPSATEFAYQARVAFESSAQLIVRRKQMKERNRCLLIQG